MGKVLSEDVEKWQAESTSIKQLLDNGNAAAQKMTMHDEADKVYAENVKKWEAVDKCIKDWIKKMELGEDIRNKMEIHEGHQTLWQDELAPSQAGEDSAECKALVGRSDNVLNLLSGLNSEADTEAA